jgi:hypothetical protein
MPRQGDRDEVRVILVAIGTPPVVVIPLRVIDVVVRWLS